MFKFTHRVLTHKMYRSYDINQSGGTDNLERQSLLPCRCTPVTPGLTKVNSISAERNLCLLQRFLAVRQVEDSTRINAWSSVSYLTRYGKYFPVSQGSCLFYWLCKVNPEYEIPVAPPQNTSSETDDVMHSEITFCSFARRQTVLFRGSPPTAGRDTPTILLLASPSLMTSLVAEVCQFTQPNFSTACLRRSLRDSYLNLLGPKF
jgi:hypothetical protein